MKAVAFLSSLPASSGLVQRSVPKLMVMDPRNVYDITAAASYGVFLCMNYWKYPDNNKRPDVELLAAMLALLWHWFCRFDISVYGYLGGVGLASFVHSRLLGANKDAASGPFVGVHLCGQIALLLLLMDILTKR